MGLYSELIKRIKHFPTSRGNEITAKNRMEEAATAPVIWVGNLHKACSANWAGMTLSCKEVTRTHWWWSVYDGKTNSVVMDSRMTYIRATTGKKARQAAEQAARQWLERDDDTD